MNEVVDLNSRRAAEARLGRSIGSSGYHVCVLLGTLASGAAIVSGFLIGVRFSCWFGALALIFIMIALWWKRQLSVLPASDKSLTGRLSSDVLARLKPTMTLQPQSVWESLADHWQATFFINHLLLHPDDVRSALSTDAAELEHALQIALTLADQNNSSTIELGFVIAGLLLAAPAMQPLLIHRKATPADVEAMAHWLGRNLDDSALLQRKFGGIGRDWAFGFTPLLNRYGHNVSLNITTNGAHFDWLTKSAGVIAIETAFTNHTTAVALIGPDGIGKTSSVYALAQRLIEGDTDKSLAYHQIIALNATDITSNARQPGQLEQIMISLSNEASLAGHIILFFDNAELFFDDRPGAFDATSILSSIIQARLVTMILAMTPSDYQRLRSRSQSLAGLLTPVILQELPEDGVMRVLEDTAAGLEHHNNVLIAYEALHEAYRLSGRYEQEEAYPGKAIKLLEQAVSHSEQSVVTASSVQQAIEQTRGVKVGQAGNVEADALLHLEDKIHQRMINQTHAVNVVANALRRARAGIANPRRPIGSFLFLGPTGVGKTELAKAIAATYFSDEHTMIRLDMSEYQEPNDVQRLLSNGTNDTSSLIMAIRQQPFAVVLLDEIEKAHPNVLNLLLQLLDEGQLTDAGGRPASFRDSIIIVTSNAGAQSIRERVAQGQTLESFQAELTDQLISSGQFKPELLNRFDDIVLFRPLTQPELAQVVGLMMHEINQTLKNQNISVVLSPAAVNQIVTTGYDPRLGARPMRRALQAAVEDVVAQKILQGEAPAGSQLLLDVANVPTKPAAN